MQQVLPKLTDPLPVFEYIPEPVPESSIEIHLYAILDDSIYVGSQTEFQPLF